MGLDANRKQLKKVMFVIGNLSGGGAERVVSVLANAFTEHGVHVCICCIGRKQTAIKYPLDTRIKVIQISMKDKIAVIGKTRQWICLRKEIKSFDADVVVAFMSYIAVQVLLSMLFSNVPVIYAVRANAYDEVGTQTLKVLTGLLYGRAKGAVYQTKQQQDYFRQSTQRKETIILNPVAEDPLWSESRPQSRTVIVSVGRLSNTQKDFPLLIRAFAKITNEFPEYILEILGYGPDRAKLEELAEEYGVRERVRFPGFVCDVSSRVFSSALFVFSSNSEGMPNALIEAMCLGVPCITTDFDGGGVEMLIEDHKNGIIVSKGDVSALASAMREVLNDVEMRERMGRQAIKLRKKVHADNIAEQWLTFLDGIVQ